jgi:hypothetical protein
MKKVDKLPEGTVELKVKGYNDDMVEYNDLCTSCGKRFTYWAKQPNRDRDHYCSADCEQESFDKGNDPTLWSPVKRLEVGYNKSRLMLAQHHIREINKAALQLEDLLSDWDMYLVTDVEVKSSVENITAITQEWLDAIDRKFSEESND